MLTTLAQVLVTLVALSTPCAYEDSTNCYWDAASRGNGLGHSFVTVTP